MKKLCKGTVKSLIVYCATITTMNFYSVKSKVSYIFLFNGAAIYILTRMCFYLQFYGKPSAEYLEKVLTLRNCLRILHRRNYKNTKK